MAVQCRPQPLSAQCWDAAFGRSAELTREAKRLDPSTWSQLQPCADIFDYLEMKIVHNLNGLRQCRQAGWEWRMYLDHAQPRRGMLWSTGTSEASESSPYDGSPEFGATWWPVIFMVPESGGILLVPFYCPALAWNKSRPWYCNLGRIYEIVGAQGVYRAPSSRHIATTTLLDHGCASFPALKESDDVSVYPAAPQDHVDASALKDSDDVSEYPAAPLDQVDALPPRSNRWNRPK